MSEQYLQRKAENIVVRYSERRHLATAPRKSRPLTYELIKYHFKQTEKLLMRKR
jgi:hypothetical protein